jgi:hypothetical protein
MADKTTTGPLPDIDTLEIVSFWREDLTARLKRAQLRYELTGTCREEIISLGDECRDFARLCGVLKAVVGHA